MNVSGCTSNPAGNAITNFIPPIFGKAVNLPGGKLTWGNWESRQGGATCKYAASAVRQRS